MTRVVGPGSGQFAPFHGPTTRGDTVLTDMDNWIEIRRRVLVDGQSMRSVQREFHLHWKTLRKILDHPEPPGYRQQRPRAKPKIGPFLPVLHQILEDDKRAPKK